MRATENKPWLRYYQPEQIAKVYKEQTITDYLYSFNKDRMDIPALNYFDRVISMQELFNRIYDTANAFASLGVKENDFVLVCSAAMPEVVSTFYGLSLLGAASNMIDPRYSTENIHGAILEVDAKIVVTIDSAYEKMLKAVKGTNVKKIIVLSVADSMPDALRAQMLHMNPRKENMPDICCHWAEFIAAGKDFKTEYLHNCADHCVVVVHTGGTTGTSKSVMLSHNNINNVSFQFVKRSTVEPGKDSFLDVMPPFIAYGLGYGIHLPLAIGMRSIIIPKLEPEKLAGYVLKYKPQQIACTPSMFKVMVRDERMQNADLSFFKNSCCGGDALALNDEQNINQFLKEHNAKWKITKGYGLSEVGAVSTACMYELNKLGSVGVPLPDITIAAFDPETGEEMEMGEVGELCINGPTTMMGYYGQPEETANVLRKHDDGLTWVHTGDLGYLDEEGFVFISGRIKRMFMDHIGFKIFPAPIEDAISHCEYTIGSCVIGVPDTNHVQGYVPHAFVVLAPEYSDMDKEEVKSALQEICEQKLVEYMRPADYTFIDALPITPVGKVDFRRLEEMYKLNHQ